MTAYLDGLRSFSIESRSTRDEVMANGYKIQRNEQSNMVLRFPDKMRVDMSGGLQQQTYFCDGAMLGMYSPEQAVFVRTPAPDSVIKLIGGLLDAGIELPMIDMLYQGANGSLTEEVRGGVLAGESTIDSVACDYLAFRQDSADWQLWVARGEQPLPRRLLITTRNEVGDPQFEVTMTWNLKPQLSAGTFSSRRRRAPGRFHSPVRWPSPTLPDRRRTTMIANNGSKTLLGRVAVTSLGVALFVMCVDDAFARPGGGGGRLANSSVAGVNRVMPRPNPVNCPTGNNRPMGNNRPSGGFNGSGNRVNVGSDVNSNIDRGYDRDHHNPRYDNYHPVARGVVIGAVAATTTAVLGSSYYALPPSGCTVVIRKGLSYSRCGSVYYQQTWAGGDVVCVVVDP